MRNFIQWLEDSNSRDTKVRAVLRRSLAFDPGSYIPAYPYVEPFLNLETKEWRRKVLYLVAGLWALHWCPDRKGAPISIARACAEYQIATGSASTERRFISLLDSDEDQLPHRLRQIAALLKEYPIDFETLVASLFYWPSDQKRSQNEWARDFYRALNHETANERKFELETDI